MEMRSKMENKGPLSSLLSPLSSPLAPAASWAQLYTWLGCFHWQAVRAMKQEGTRDLGHLDNMRPHNLLFTAYPNRLSLPLSLPLSTLTISFTISNISSLRLSLFPSCTIFFFTMSRLSSIRFSVCACHFLSLILPPSFCPPVALSYCHICMFLLLGCHVPCFCLSHTSFLANRKMRREGENETEKTESPGCFRGG